MPDASEHSRRIKVLNANRTPDTDSGDGRAQSPTREE
jgi:hypothetical protein